MDVRVAQLNSRVGDLEANAAALIGSLQRAGSADLVVTPEMALCGYPPQDLLDWPVFIDRVARATQHVIESSHGPGLLFGTIWQKDGSLYNGAVLAHRGKEIARVAKRLLPRYDVFDERRWFDPGSVAKPIDFAGQRLGVHICEDAWTEHYDSDPIADLCGAGADVLINLSASPWSREQAELREKICRDHAIRHGVDYVLANLVGANDELIFDGGSLIIAANGEVQLRAPQFESGMFGTGLTAAWTTSTEQLFLALAQGIQDYCQKTGFKRVIIGLSGGIDSALVAVLSCHALGAENVELVAMPGPHSSKASFEDARQLSLQLGVELRVHPIHEMFAATESSYKVSFGRELSGLARQNAQSRCRGATLMTLSNDLGALVLNTGNKSEMATGYCTLLGDICGALSILGDLLKSEIVELCTWLKEERGLQSLAAIIAKPPSAELAPDQLDHDSLPPYDVLDSIVDGLVRQHEAPRDLGPEAEHWQTVIDRNEYKRRQAPPVLRVTTKAFGRGRRRPLAQGFDPDWCP